MPHRLLGNFKTLVTWRQKKLLRRLRLSPVGVSTIAGARVIVSIVIALGAEIWAGNQRTRIIESLLETKGKVTKKMIEDYVPAPAETAKWQEERAEMVKRVYAVLARDTGSAQPFATERKFQ